MGRQTNQDARLTEHYCETLGDMQQRCEELDLNFRTEMMSLAERWLESHLEQNATDGKQTRKTR